MENQTTTEKLTKRKNQDRTSPQKIEQIERLQKAIRMRKDGFTYEEIADALGWKSRQAAQDAVKRVLERALLDDARELKLINLMRLERAIAPVMAKIEKGSLLAVDRLIKISKREGEILGFDAVNNRDLNIGFEIVVRNESDREKGNY